MCEKGRGGHAWDRANVCPSKGRHARTHKTHTHTHTHTPRCSPASDLLRYAFEKADAKEKWGGENIFRAMMGGRSLRATGEAVYGSSCMEYGVASVAERDVNRAVRRGWSSSRLAGTGGVGDPPAFCALFGDVGGVAVWREMLERMPGFGEGYGGDSGGYVSGDSG
jgi:hypothetical protein